ncbi:hypothetical protein HY250_01415 [Candidatus Azambacteria bacterium]|nr:hypothetical protein [Candidatus Azambacteria bacterium]MBI3685039.1 hypothetical protein [Candidatus Azambacteria bacterium]
MKTPAFRTLYVTAFLSVGFFVFPFQGYAFFAQNEGTLMKGSGERVYFLENGMKRWVPDAAAFNSFEFNWDAIQTVSDEDLLGYPTGKNLDSKSRYPDGALVRANKAEGGDGVKVYLVERGARRWIQTEQDFGRLGLEWYSIHDVSPKKLKSISEGKLISAPQFTARPLTVIQETPPAMAEDVSVKFKITGVVARQDNRALTFETFLEGVDSGWVTSGQERRITLPKKNGVYRFFARAKDPDGNVDKIPKWYSFELKISPYFGKISLSGSPRATDPLQEQITLASIGANDPIAIGGWMLGSERRNTGFAIPSEAYEISNQPLYEYKVPLMLTSKSKIILYSGVSPSGVNFRLNKCVGYLNTYYKFTPALPNMCPQTNQDEVKRLSTYCQKVIAGLSSCKEANAGDPLLDTECHDYVKERFSYSQCVERNHTYYDFLLDEWRVYMNQSKEIWPNDSDAIILRDKDGLLVARFSY